MANKPGHKRLFLKWRNVVLLTILPLLTYACASATYSPERMVPPLQTSSAWTTGRSVKVMEVTGKPGNKGPFPFQVPQLSNDEFRQALIITLKKSGLFSEVSADRGDLALYAAIRSQTVKGVVGEETAVIIVSYKFVDNTGQVVWNDSYESQFSSVELGAPSTRMVKIREGSVRENLSSLVHGIKTRWPR